MAERVCGEKALRLNPRPPSWYCWLLGGDIIREVLAYRTYRFLFMVWVFAW